MKSLSAWVGVSFLVAGLTICSSAVWGADWKEFAEATTGIFRYDAASISSPSEGFVRVWINNMNKNETNLVEFNCKDISYQVLSVVQWDGAYQIKSREDYYDQPNPNWLKFSRKSVPEALYQIACP
jgi:hypothetical protein